MKKIYSLRPKLYSDSTAEIAAHRVTASRATDVAGRRTHAYPIQACKCNATTASLRYA
jgi:hypothetical protein